MADYREGLHLIPEHMHEGMTMWIERGEPHPSIMGSFQKAVLSNDLMGACACADWINRFRLFAWADFLYNFAPAGCFGGAEQLLAWYAARHPKPPEEGKPVVPDTTEDDDII